MFTFLASGPRPCLSALSERTDVALIAPWRQTLDTWRQVQRPQHATYVLRLRVPAVVHFRVNKKVTNPALGDTGWLRYEVYRGPGRNADMEPQQDPIGPLGRHPR